MNVPRYSQWICVAYDLTPSLPRWTGTSCPVDVLATVSLCHSYHQKQRTAATKSMATRRVGRFEWPRRVSRAWFLAPSTATHCPLHANYRRLRQRCRNLRIPTRCWPRLRGTGSANRLRQQRNLPSQKHRQPGPTSTCRSKTRRPQGCARCNASPIHTEVAADCPSCRPDA